MEKADKISAALADVGHEMGKFIMALRRRNKSPLISYCRHPDRAFAEAQDERQLPGMRQSSICRGRPAAMGRVLTLHLHSLQPVRMSLMGSFPTSSAPQGQAPGRPSRVVASGPDLPFEPGPRHVRTMDHSRPLDQARQRTGAQPSAGLHAWRSLVVRAGTKGR